MGHTQWREWFQATDPNMIEMFQKWGNSELPLSDLEHATDTGNAVSAAHYHETMFKNAARSGDLSRTMAHMQGLAKALASVQGNVKLSEEWRVTSILFSACANFQPTLEGQMELLKEVTSVAQLAESTFPDKADKVVALRPALEKMFDCQALLASAEENHQYESAITHLDAMLSVAHSLGSTLVNEIVDGLAGPVRRLLQFKQLHKEATLAEGSGRWNVATIKLREVIAYMERENWDLDSIKEMKAREFEAQERLWDKMCTSAMTAEREARFLDAFEELESLINLPFAERMWGNKWTEKHSYLVGHRNRLEMKCRVEIERKRRNAEKLCCNCGKESKAVCAGCNCAFYCSKKCQKGDWKMLHKQECKKLS